MREKATAIEIPNTLAETALNLSDLAGIFAQLGTVGGAGSEITAPGGTEHPDTEALQARHTSGDEEGYPTYQEAYAWPAAVTQHDADVPYETEPQAGGGGGDDVPPPPKVYGGGENHEDPEEPDSEQPGPEEPAEETVNQWAARVAREWAIGDMLRITAAGRLVVEAESDHEPHAAHASNETAVDIGHTPRHVWPSYTEQPQQPDPEALVAAVDENNAEFPAWPPIPTEAPPPGPYTAPPHTEVPVTQQPSIVGNVPPHIALPENPTAEQEIAYWQYNLSRYEAALEELRRQPDPDQRSIGSFTHGVYLARNEIERITRGEEHSGRPRQDADPRDLQRIVDRLRADNEGAGPQ